MSRRIPPDLFEPGRRQRQRYAFGVLLGLLSFGDEVALPAILWTLNTRGDLFGSIENRLGVHPLLCRGLMTNDWQSWVRALSATPDQDDDQNVLRAVTSLEGDVRVTITAHLPPAVSLDDYDFGSGPAGPVPTDPDAVDPDSGNPDDVHPNDVHPDDVGPDAGVPAGVTPDAGDPVGWEAGLQPVGAPAERP